MDDTRHIPEIARITVCFRSITNELHQVGMVTDEDHIVAKCMVTGDVTEIRRVAIQHKMLELFRLCVPDCFDQYEQ